MSGLTVEELRAGTTHDEALARRAAAAGAEARALTAREIAPMAAESGDEAFARAGWIFELKYDGVRTLALRQPDRPVRLLSRTLRDVTRSFPDIALAIERLPCRSFVLDGEIAALDERGHPSFPLLQQRLMQTDARAVATAMIEVPVLLFAFDLLAVSGYDVRALPLTTRKELLRTLVPTIGVVRYVDHYERDGATFFNAAQALGIEGIVAKNASSRYASGRRSREWLKIKGARSADLAVVGFVPGKGSRAALGSLMLAWRDGEGFRYAGNVGSGLTAALIADLLPRLRAAQRDTPVFPPHVEPLAKGAVLVEPELVAEVRYTEVLASGVLRHPVFVRLRDDKTVETCDAQPASATVREPRPVRAVEQPRVFQPSNVDKIFWPADGYTKGDLLRYYQAVWPALAPYLRDRPVVLTRYPDGIEGKSFFQKNAPEFVPDWVQTSRIDDTDYFICNDVQSLLYVINMGCIPLHFWSARRPSLDRPDWTILDLDPKGAPFSAVVQIARAIHALLEPMHVPHFVKTSGQDGLHVLVPLGAALSHEHARMLAELIARVIAAELPDIATVARPLSDRGGKVYVDFLQNGYGKTIVAPFSVRPRPGAPVSTWLDWRELTARLKPARFTIRSLPPHIDERGGPGAALIEGAADVGALLAALERRGQQ
jgi:bifunctional non-homologous end joining protein LigD